MLLEFKFENYKSFAEETIFSMIPAPKQKGLDYSILKTKIKSKKYKALCSSVIYGPNASGKTNFIGAMDTFKKIVLRGNINNSKSNIAQEANIAVNILELIPNNTNKYAKPVKFSIKFIENNLLIEYSLSIYIGEFAEMDVKRKIVSEKLLVNDIIIYERDDELSFGNLSKISGFLIENFENNKESAKELAKNGLNEKELFLSNGFKNIFSPKLSKLITNWLEKKFVTIYKFNQSTLEIKIPNKIELNKRDAASAIKSNKYISEVIY